MDTNDRGSYLAAPRSGRLPLDECWDLVRGSHVGRLATAAEERADIFPVNYIVDGGTILFRSAPGSKLQQLTAAPHVAFEVDGRDGTRYWSVVVHGTAHRLDDDRDIIRSGVLALVTSSPTEKHNFVRITPTTVTGVEVPVAPE